MLRRIRFHHVLFVGAMVAAIGSGFAADTHAANLSKALDGASYVMLVAAFVGMLA